MQWNEKKKNAPDFSAGESLYDEIGSQNPAAKEFIEKTFPDASPGEKANMLYDLYNSK